MSGKTGPTWPCSATTTSIKFLIRWSSYGFSKLVPTNIFCNHEEILRRPFVIYSLTHANRKASCSLLFFKSGASTLSEPPSRGIMYSSGFHGICRLLHTLAENGCLSGVGRTIFFNKTKCYRTSISSQTMCI